MSKCNCYKNSYSPANSKSYWSNNDQCLCESGYLGRCWRLTGRAYFVTLVTPQCITQI